MERSRGHVHATQSRDLASPIYGNFGALTEYTRLRYLLRDLISLETDTCVCNRCKGVTCTQLLSYVSPSTEYSFGSLDQENITILF